MRASPVSIAERIASACSGKVGTGFPKRICATTRRKAQPVLFERDALLVPAAIPEQVTAIVPHIPFVLVDVGAVAADVGELIEGIAEIAGS